MKRLALSLALLFAPVLMLGYYHLGKLLLRTTEAAKFLDTGGSISTVKIDEYEASLTKFVYFGMLSALLLGVEAARLIKARIPSPSV